MKISECFPCMSHYRASPMLTESCASVGISLGKSTADMVVSYLRRYHRNGHREECREPGCDDLCVGAMGYCQIHLDGHRDRINSPRPWPAIR